MSPKLGACHFFLYYHLAHLTSTEAQVHKIGASSHWWLLQLLPKSLEDDKKKSHWFLEYARRNRRLFSIPVKQGYQRYIHILGVWSSPRGQPRAVHLACGLGPHPCSPGKDQPAALSPLLQGILNWVTAARRGDQYVVGADVVPCLASASPFSAKPWTLNIWAYPRMCKQEV